MADVKWIKIVTDIFDDDKILLIEDLPEANAIIVIWFKLLCLAGKQNNSGVFVLNDKIAYTEKMLAAIFRRKESVVSMALKTFEELGMIKIVEGVVTIPNWGKYQSLDKIEKRNEYMRDYMKEYREKQKLLACKPNGKVNSKVNSKPNGKVNVNSLDIDKEKDKRKRKEGDIDKNNTPAQSYEAKPIPSELYADVEAVILNDNSEWKPTQSAFEEYVRLYPGVDVKQAFREMRAWCINNPTKRKTRNGVKRFVGGWLGRAQDESTRKGTENKSSYIDAVKNRVSEVDDWV